MKYINVVTKEHAVIAEVCRRLNASIPSGVAAGDWVPVQIAPRPEEEEGFVITEGDIVEQDGQYVLQWNKSKDVEVVPQSVTSFQAYAQLSEEGVLAMVEQYMDATDTPEIEKIAFRRAPTFERNSPTVAKLATMLNWDSAKLDQVFIDASKKTA